MRPVLALLLALLLLGMQHEAQRHPLEHLAGGPRTQDQVVDDAGPAGGCALCALLASGCDAPVGDQTPAAGDADLRRPVDLPDYLLAGRAPAFYSSRAPPSLA